MAIAPANIAAVRKAGALAHGHGVETTVDPCPE